MIRPALFAMIGALALAACSTAPTASRMGPDGRPLPQLYKINPAQTGTIQLRLQDGLNSLRRVAGAPAVALNANLTASAATHSRDMSVQNRPWHFGSDGSSPLDRAQRAGYTGVLLGELISETYETEMETLAAWMEQPETRAILLDPQARDLGFAFFQEQNGKIWWTLATGTPYLAPDQPGT